MAGIPHQIIESIKKFKEKISSDLKIKKVILFGSYSNGSFSEESDIDLCIIAEDVDNSFLATLRIAPKIIGIDLRIEPLVFSVKDYEENSKFGILKEIKEQGIEL
jgi:predicted nucleotidyltransferase